MKYPEKVGIYLISDFSCRFHVGAETKHLYRYQYSPELTF